jgi:hypothetical protein
LARWQAGKPRDNHRLGGNRLGELLLEHKLTVIVVSIQHGHSVWVRAGLGRLEVAGCPGSGSSS